MTCRGLISQAAIRPLLVVVATPSFDLFLSIFHAQKPVFIPALLSETAVTWSMSTSYSQTRYLFPLTQLNFLISLILLIPHERIPRNDQVTEAVI
jgi:hypothetical protein